MASHLPLIPLFFERFIEKWAESRQKSPREKVTIERKNLYISPTRHGLIYFFVLLLILFGSINYENSLGFMLAFLLGSLGFLGMIYTHQNINQLTLNTGRAEPVFSGQEILFPITLSQTDSRLRPALQINIEKNSLIDVHLINQLSVDCKVPMHSFKRGYVKLNRIKLCSEYPFGLFHAWSWIKLDSRCLVYPAADPHHYPLLADLESSAGNNAKSKQGNEDFAGIREYQIGDQPNHMAWKAIARTGKLQTKLFSTESSDEIWISWSQTHENLDLEKRLSILVRMVLDATEHGFTFGLKIPGKIIMPDSGLQHKHHCLKKLALFAQ